MRRSILSLVAPVSLLLLLLLRTSTSAVSAAGSVPPACSVTTDEWNGVVSTMSKQFYYQVSVDSRQGGGVHRENSACHESPSDLDDPTDAD